MVINDFVSQMADMNVTFIGEVCIDYRALNLSACRSLQWVSHWIPEGSRMSDHVHNCCGPYSNLTVDDFWTSLIEFESWNEYIIRYILTKIKKDTTLYCPPVGVGCGHRMPNEMTPNKRTELWRCTSFNLSTSFTSSEIMNIE